MRPPLFPAPHPPAGDSGTRGGRCHRLLQRPAQVRLPPLASHAGSHVQGCPRRKRDLSYLQPSPLTEGGPPSGPGFSGQSMASFREACPRRGPDPPPPPHLHSGGNRKRDSAARLGPVSSRLSSNDPAWAAGNLPTAPPQPSAGRPGWQPDRWLERHTWVSDVETPSGLAAFPWEGGRCCQQRQMGAL